MDFHRQLEASFQNWTWKHLFTVLGLVALLLFGFDRFVIPRLLASDLEDDRAFTRPVVRQRTDPRMFLDVPSPQKRKNEFVVAWIVGSSARVESKNNVLFDHRAVYMLPEVFAARVPLINGKKIRVVNYSISGQHSLEFNLSLLHAQKVVQPDMYIIEVNPFSFYSNSQLYRGGNWLGNFWVWGWDKPFTWPVNLSMVPPKDVEYAVSSQLFQFSRRRYEGLQLLQSIQKNVNFQAKQRPLKQQLGAERKAAPQGKKSFWENYFAWIPENKRGHFSNRVLNAQYHSLLLNTPGPDTLGWQLLDGELQSIVSQNKPVLVYMPPIGPQLLSNSEGSLKLRAIQKALVTQVTPYMDGHPVQLALDTMDAVSGKEIYRDFIHLHQDNGLLDLLVGRIQRFPGMQLEQADISERFTQSAVRSTDMKE